MATVAFKPVRHLRVLPLRTMSDERLAELASVGHEDAFAALYERYQGALARYCRSILRDPEDARDALQNTMVAVLRAVQRRAPAGPIRPWMYRIAHNESISIIRRRHAHEELSSETPDRVDTELASIARDRLDSLLVDLRSLPDRQRGALVMRELGGLDYDEIAGALQMSAPSARKAVFEARVTLHRLADARNADCADIKRQISDGDGRVLRGRAVRGHLLACASCSAFQRELHDRQGAFALMPALPALSLAALLGVALPAGGGGSGSGFALGGTAAGGAALGGGSVAAAGGAALGSGAAVKGIAIGGALALAGAGMLVGSGLGSHARHAARLQAAVHSAPKVRSPTPTARAPRVAKPARVRVHRAFAPPPRVPQTTSDHPAPPKTPPPPARRAPAVSSRPNVTGPSVAVPVALTTPTATPAPRPPGTTSTTTAPAPAPTGTTTPPPPAVTTATALATSIIQNALQTIGANLAAAEAQAAQTLAQAGAAAGPATGTVQGLLNSLLHGGNG